MLVLSIALALVLAGPTRTPAPHVTVTDTSPFTVRGSAFKPGEQVRVVVWARTRRTRTATASSRGIFSVRLPGIKLGTCPRYTVKASGNRGSQAAVKVTPECAALQPRDR